MRSLLIFLFYLATVNQVAVPRQGPLFTGSPSRAAQLSGGSCGLGEYDVAVSARDHQRIAKWGFVICSEAIIPCVLASHYQFLRGGFAREYLSPFIGRKPWIGMGEELAILCNRFIWEDSIKNLLGHSLPEWTNRNQMESRMAHYMPSIAKWKANQAVISYLRPVSDLYYCSLRSNQLLPHQDSLLLGGFSSALGRRSLLLNLGIGSPHQDSLNQGNESIKNSRDTCISRPVRSAVLGRYKLTLFAVSLLTIGSIGLFALVWIDERGGDPGYITPLYFSSFSGIVVGGSLLLDRFINRAKLAAQQFHQSFKLMWEHRFAPTLWRRIVAADETRISRRPEDWRELQETCNGGPSKAKDNRGSEASVEGETARQEQGLEGWKFLLPRACLRGGVAHSNPCQ